MRSSWELLRRGSRALAFLAIHAGLAIAWSLAWCGLRMGMRTVVESLWTGRAQVFMLTFEELRWQLGAGGTGTTACGATTR